ncbi:hypothetical protein [Kluyvera ascorbata]|uniref:hypothetical protein n=1 Tax=Kluyvera ascorbata TaxID=51288 RepID=UPI0034D3A20C
MAKKMDYPQHHTLSALLDKQAELIVHSDQESIADLHLKNGRYEEAIVGYAQLKNTTPQLMTKIAFCEWMQDRFEDARSRLMAPDAELDAEGIGLLGMLVTHDKNVDRSNADKPIIWARLKQVVTSTEVPILAALARSLSWWPEDYHSPAGRLNDLQHLLSLYPHEQRIRLAVLTCMQRCKTSLSEQYTLISTSNSPLRMPRLLWSAAEVAASVEKADEALEYLRQLEEIERSYESPEDEILWEITLARADIKRQTAPEESMSSFASILQSASLPAEFRVRMGRAALVAVCRSSPRHIPEFAEAFMEAIEARYDGFYIQALDLYDDVFPVSGSNWDNWGNAWSCGDLHPYQDVLTTLAKPRTQRFYRIAFVLLKLDGAYEELQSDEPDLPDGFWEELDGLLGNITGHELEFDGNLLSLYTSIRSQLQAPDWNSLGQGWLTSQWLAESKNVTLHYSELALQKASNHTSALKKFTSGVIHALNAHNIPSEEAYDLIKELVYLLPDHDIKRDFYQLMGRVSDEDTRDSVLFYIGLSSHVMKYHTKAKTAYLKAIEQNPHHYSSIFNLLLLCTKEADMPLVEQIKPIVLKFESDNESKKEDLEKALQRAARRCEDKNDAKRRIVIAELDNLPPLLEHPLPLSEIPLRAAVALLALFRCANAEPGDTDLPMLDECETDFGPRISNNALLFDLLKTGLAGVHPKTSLDAFVVDDEKDEVRAWRFGRVRWRLSPACEYVMQSLRAINGDIPEEWKKSILPLAMEIARAEVAQYIGFLAQERGWPQPRSTEEVSDLTRELINELPVAETFHLAYLGAMSASDYKQKYPVSGQMAADMLVKRTGQRLESVRSGKFPSKAYDRPWKLPRSAISFALWGTLLDKGDSGFTNRISDLTTSLN